jgi:Holliday junction resolvase RusA-like endonuclease
MSELALQFTVLGLPQPQGSKTSGMTKGGRAFVRDDNPHLRPWRQAIASAALDAVNGAPMWFGPVALTVRFVFPRPKGHYGTGRNQGVIKSSAPLYVRTRPDVDKLVRAIADAVTGIVLHDDSQLVAITATKVYGEPPRAEVELEPILPHEDRVIDQVLAELGVET